MQWQSLSTCFHFQGTQAEWQIVFFICSGMYAFGAIFYIIFADGEEQEWAKQKDRPDANQYPATDFTEDHEETLQALKEHTPKA